MSGKWDKLHKKLKDMSDKWDKLNKELDDALDAEFDSEEPKQVYYNTVGRENGVLVIKGQFNTQKEALDLANDLNKKFPDLYHDWSQTFIKEESKQESVFENAKSTFRKHLFDNKAKVARDLEQMREWSNSNKQETLEEAELTKFALSEAKKWVGEDNHHKIATYATAILVGAKWQQEQNKNLYSEEEVLEQLNLLYSMKNALVDTFTDDNDYITMKWFKQFKKK